MADLSDAIGEDTKRRMEQLALALIRRGRRHYRDNKDADYQKMRDRLTEINASRPDDPWVALRCEMKGRFEKLPDGSFAYVTAGERMRRFESEFKERFGSSVPHEFVRGHLLFSRRNLKEVCEWCRANGWAKEIKPIDSEFGRDVTFLTVGCPDEAAALEVFQDLHESGVYDVCRSAEDQTVLVVGYGSDEELPEIVSCLARHGIGRDAVRGIGQEAAEALGERSGQPREAGVPEPPETLSDAVCESEDIAVTLAAACRNERERSWSTEPPTPAMEARISQLAEQGRIPEASMEAYAAVRNKLTAHRLLNAYDDVSFGVVGRKPRGPEDPEGPQGTATVRQAAEPSADATRTAGTHADEAAAERALEDLAPERADGRDHEDMARPDATKGPGASEQSPQREYGAKEIYTGDRVVEASTMDKANPVSSDGQDAVERNDSEDDVTARREADARRELESYDAERGNDYLSEQKADATMASAVEEHAGREEVSIPDPQR